MSTSARREHGREVQRMIETKIREYLLSNVYTAIYLETPKTMPDECVIFRIIDRSWSNLIDTVTVEINSYAKTKEEAAELDASVRRAMNAFSYEDDISASKLSGGNDANDTTLKRYRYRCFYNITYMEE
jgi:hypothetical protein